MTRINYSAPCLVLAASLFALACSHSQPPAQAAEPASSVASATPEKKQTDVASRANISIAEDVKKACGIADPDAYFAFDSSHLTEQDDRVLGKLASCFTSGAMRGKTMRLVGHTDPRGDDDYNMLLGQRRADGVKAFLGEKSLAPNQVETSSRGKMDAVGHDEASYAKDRRVDVLSAS